MKRIICMAACICSILFTYAQTTLKGRVVDADNNLPLAGANITAGGRTVTTTDHDGFFYIDCSKTTRITISFIGYESMQHSIRNCNEELGISLVPFSQSLNNVEITATSNQNKS